MNDRWPLEANVSANATTCIASQSKCDTRKVKTPDGGMCEVDEICVEKCFC